MSYILQITLNCQVSSAVPFKMMFYLPLLWTIYQFILLHLVKQSPQTTDIADDINVHSYSYAKTTVNRSHDGCVSAPEASDSDMGTTDFTTNYACTFLDPYEYMFSNHTYLNLYVLNCSKKGLSINLYLHHQFATTNVAEFLFKQHDSP